MAGFRKREAYWDDAAARKAFQIFVQEIHQLDFSAWEAAGHWDDNYRPFSLFDDDGRVISSVCVYSLDMIVNGTPVRAAQISGVGTDPAHRRQGLNRDLTAWALAWARDTHDFFFLFSDKEAIPFYAHCGFDSVDEYLPRITVRGSEPIEGVHALDVSNAADLDRIRKLAMHRAPVSNRLGVLSTDLLVFHALYPLREVLHIVEPLDAIVAFRRKAEKLAVYDVLAERMPTWKDLAPFLTVADTTEVAFSFCPDVLAPDGVTWDPYPVNDLHDRGDLPLRGQTFLFPFTAHA